MKRHFLAALTGLVLSITILIIGGMVSTYICMTMFPNFADCANNPVIETLLLSFIILAGVVFLIPYWLIFKENMPKFIRRFYEIYNQGKDE